MYIDESERADKTTCLCHLINNLINLASKFNFERSFDNPSYSSSGLGRRESLDMSLVAFDGSRDATWRRYADRHLIVSDVNDACIGTRSVYVPRYDCRSS